MNFPLMGSEISDNYELEWNVPFHAPSISPISWSLGYLITSTNLNQSH
jgi:hypothetical protein